MYSVRSLVPVEAGSAECSKCGEGKLEYAIVRSTRTNTSWFAFHCRTCSALFDAQESQHLQVWAPPKAKLGPMGGTLAEPIKESL